MEEKRNIQISLEETREWYNSADPLQYLNNIIMKKKYKVTFYTIKGNKFFRICTRTYKSTLKFAFKTALKQCAVFIIKEH